MSNYSFAEHAHRFAVWAAGRAYSRSGGDGGGYSVPYAQRMLEAAGMRDINTPEDLPCKEGIDAFIHERIEAVRAARPATYVHHKTGKNETFRCTYGRAQKLVNVYLKSKLVCGGYHDDERVERLHPPIDRKLLIGLSAFCEVVADQDEYAEFRKNLLDAQALGDSWVIFSQSTYEAYIKAIQSLQQDKPLWAVEEHWLP
ncbi:hypothetical protein KW849_14085 [Pseudomonas sp. PDM26]|uniref:hypothetical protein n=1 Tax=Pseudomonas sp. PDM26 TaxID=2854766 RepID=UPI001C46C922|nr:hypothetical protein [Pseudomonas sp. PDM26]MBV7547416.1 hypothetical protein [Pseudomonas sp. PDM26]